MVKFKVQILKKILRGQTTTGQQNTGYGILGDGMSGSWLSTNIVKSKIPTQNNTRVRVFSDARRITGRRCVFSWDTLTEFDATLYLPVLEQDHPPPVRSLPI